MKLSYREKVGLLIVVVLAVIIVFVAWPIKTIKANIKAHKEEQTTVKAEYDETQRKIAEIPVIEGNINALYESSKGLSEKFVEHMDNIEVAHYFETLLNKEPYKKSGKNDLEIIDGLTVSNAGTGVIPFYYYTPDVITYPILEAADTNGNLLETTDKALYEKTKDALAYSEFEQQTVETRTVTVPMKFKKDALLALEDELAKNETGIRISSVEIDDYTFNYITEIPEDKGYSTGTVTFEFYTMQQIQKPDFSK
ncbi:MAG: hypothetical protein IJL67_00795 [Oscillospiraceae bacterium]|nr:hypothetical protein [Oscillospiraceae bacterium]